jgi:hypothetical protein
MDLKVPDPTAWPCLPVKTERILAFARAPHDASYWGEKMAGFDFSRSDHLDTVRFNRVLWAGLKGENAPYPTTRSGRDLRKNRQWILANFIHDRAKQEKQSASAVTEPETTDHSQERLR